MSGLNGIRLCFTFMNGRITERLWFPDYAIERIVQKILPYHISDTGVVVVCGFDVADFLDIF